MGKMIELTASDGHRLAAYCAEPPGPVRGGVVVIQEIFGVNSHIKAVSDGFAADGYVAIAPALFDRVERNVDLGYTADTVAAGRELRAGVAIDDAIKDVAAAVAAAAPQGKVGLVGYCWGGFVVWMAAARVDGLSAAVSYYGGGVLENASERPRCPTMLHFGEQDSISPPEKVAAFAAAHPTLAVHIYPA
ncbi:MAG TPA: dienelactone hydrolase family protein, partial [Kofleriaceae bacterium]|nr:dienelactone hydrolase family protein [Kofleriaceae bacterium]